MTFNHMIGSVLLTMVFKSFNQFATIGSIEGQVQLKKKAAFELYLLNSNSSVISENTIVGGLNTDSYLLYEICFKN